MISAIGSTLPGLRIDQTTGMAGAGAPATGLARQAAGADFTAAMAQVANDAMNSLKSAETASIQGVQGQATTQAVVEAVMNAERTLQTAVAVRDKAVAAYLELSRMSI